MKFHQPFKAIATAVILLTALGGCNEDSVDSSSNETSALSAEDPLVSAAVEDTPEPHYQQYCALCHGDNREGYANDSAPSLQLCVILEHRESQMSNARNKPEFKDEAVSQVVDRGHSVAEVAERLGAISFRLFMALRL